MTTAAVTMENALTADETESIRAELAKKYHYNKQRCEAEVARALFEAQWGTSQFAGDEQVKWICRIITDLTEETFQPPKLRYTTTVAEIRAAFEKQLADGLEDAIADFEHDPSWYKSGKPTAETHPWAADITAKCRKVLDLSPYRLWKFVRDVEEFAFDAVRENLLDMVTGSEDGERVKKEAGRAYTETLKKLEAELAA